MHIGGTDSPVIKHPHTLEPYIPGSSIKGKVRSLLEMESGMMLVTDGKVIAPTHLKDSRVTKEMNEKAEAIIRLFGSSGAELDEEGKFGPTRVSFADCYLHDEWKKKARANRWPLTEEKSENNINRIQGIAQSPRFIERVPEGTEFDFTVSFKVLNDGEEAIFEDLLFRGLKFVEMDALGGSGSRGYGRVQFAIEGEAGERFRKCDPFA